MNSIKVPATIVLCCAFDAKLALLTGSSLSPPSAAQCEPFRHYNSASTSVSCLVFEKGVPGKSQRLPSYTHKLLLSGFHCWHKNLGNSIQPQSCSWEQARWFSDADVHALLQPVHFLWLRPRDPCIWSTTCGSTQACSWEQAMWFLRQMFMSCFILLIYFAKDPCM